MFRTSSKLFKVVVFTIALALQMSGIQAYATPPTTTGPVADSVGSNTEAYLNGQTLRDQATLADGTVVQVGTSALLTPGVGDREIHTTYNSNVVYQAGSAVAPEGWTLSYSTDFGVSWTTTEPVPASSVTDIKAVKSNVAAGLISGFSQAYSTETTAAVPASTFSAGSAGDGWGVTLMDNYVFNIYHHYDYLGLDCHLKSDSSSCYSDGQPKVIQGPFGENYATGARSNPIADPQTGRLYFFTIPLGGPNYLDPGVLCINVADPTNPSSCGFTALSDTSGQNFLPSWYSGSQLSQLVRSGTKYFATFAGDNTVLCFDSVTQAACAGNEAPLVSPSQNYYPNRLLVHGTNLYVMTDSALECFKISDLSSCSGGSWPSYVPGNNPLGMFVKHENSSGIVDGFCSADWCWDLSGAVKNWLNPVAYVGGYSEIWQDALVTNHRAYIFTNVSYQVACFDYLTGDYCSGFTSPAILQNTYNYQLVADPNNVNCLWYNSNEGVLGNFDASSGNAGCSENPVVTLEPSQFAPRYACSSVNGITSWDTLRISSLVGGGTANSILLTVRDANGTPVTGWTNVPISLGVDLNMAGLDVALSGSRPTFSFAFMGVQGTISSATIALDYKGKGPELCSSVQLNAGGVNLPLSTSIYGSLIDSVSSETYPSVRALNIDSQDGVNLFLGTPGAPQNLAGSGLNTSANLTFEPPLTNGGSAVTGYLYSIDGGTTWLTPSQTIDNGDGTFTIPLTGLTAGQTYDMQVLAENTIGRGTAASLQITVQLVEPSNVQDTPVDQGPIYLATVNGNNLPYTYTVSPSTVCTVTNNVITLVDVGSCSVTADQAGDDTHIATSDTSTFTVLPAAVVQTAPSEVLNLAATASSGQVLLTWDLPSSDGNSAITDYVIQFKVGSSYVPFVDGVSTTRSSLITGLTNGTTYLFRVAAKNAIGQSSFAVPVSAVPADVPGQSTNLAVSISGTDASVSWQAPVSNGGSAITDYVVSYKVRTSPTWVVFTDGVSDQTGATVSGLDGVSDYDFMVQAQNAMGLGSAVSTVDVQASISDSSVTLNWVAPLVGSPVNYVVSYREVGTSTWTDIDTQSTSLSLVISSLTNGTEYEFSVAAMADAVTVQSYSSTISATPLGTPTAPTVTTVAGASQVTVSWTGATGNGGTITDYIVHYRAVGSNVWRTANDGFGLNSDFTVLNLINGTQYEFEVAGVSSVGTGAYSSAVTATPRRAPGAPSVSFVSTTHTTATVAWTDPADNGGSGITGYVVQFRERSAVIWTTYAGNEFTGSSVIIRNLTPNTNYTFRVAAVNDAGAGNYSTSALGVTMGYIVTFHRAGATSGNVPLAATAGGRYTLPDNTRGLARTGYTFLGWILDGTSYTVGQQITVTKNTNLFARWVRCSITYVAPTKSSGSVPPSISGCTNRIVRANVGNLKRTGYYFSGWSINGTTYRPGETIAVEGRYTAIAQWSRFTITYMGARSTGGTTPAATSGYGATTLAANSGTLVREGYTFGGWILGTTTYQPGDSFQLKGNVKAFAKWIKNGRGNNG